MKSKKFKNVNLGDKAVDCRNFVELGFVTWKGSFKEAMKTQSSNYSKSEYQRMFTKKELKNLNMVSVASSDEPDFQTLMAYNFDSSSATVLKN